MDLKQLIQSRFISTEAYLRPRLTLSEMADIVGSNRTYLSRYLNRELKTTFYEYLNSLRLDYAMRIAEQEPSLRLQEIADRAGFTSYATFRRVFTARFGVNPSGIRQRLTHETD